MCLPTFWRVIWQKAQVQERQLDSDIKGEICILINPSCHFHVFMDVFFWMVSKRATHSIHSVSFSLFIRVFNPEDETCCFVVELLKTLMTWKNKWRNDVTLGLMWLRRLWSTSEFRRPQRLPLHNRPQVTLTTQTEMVTTTRSPNECGTKWKQWSSRIYKSRFNPSQKKKKQ